MFKGRLDIKLPERVGEGVEVGVAAHAREFLGVAVDELHVAEGFEVDGINGLVVAVGALCWARRRRCGVHGWLYLYKSCCFEWEDKRDWTKWSPAQAGAEGGGGRSGCMELRSGCQPWKICSTVMVVVVVVMHVHGAPKGCPEVSCAVSREESEGGGEKFL